MTRKVLRVVHDLMHQGYVADVDFDALLEDYLRLCSDVLGAINRADQAADFEAHLRDMAARLPAPGRIMLLHEHPAYMLADFLAVPYHARLFYEIIDQVMTIADCD